jgi:hypothetical protein
MSKIRTWVEKNITGGGSDFLRPPASGTGPAEEDRRDQEIESLMDDQGVVPPPPFSTEDDGVSKRFVEFCVNRFIDR